MSDDAWRLFRRLIGDAGAEWRLVQAWRDVRAVEAKFGWDWPSYETVLRRWHALPAARRVALRHGTDAAVKALRSRCCATRRASRPSNGSSLGGRTLDFRVDWGDGRGVRPVMLALADVASNVVLGWELTDGEDAAATVRLICRVCRVCRVCREHGIFDRLHTDNGRAFSGHEVAGGGIGRRAA